MVSQTVVRLLLLLRQLLFLVGGHNKEIQVEIIQFKPHMFTNTQYCRQRYIKLVPAVSRSLKVNLFISMQNIYCWHIETGKFHLTVKSAKRLYCIAVVVQTWPARLPR
jgi:hypothetical protein